MLACRADGDVRRQLVPDAVDLMKLQGTLGVLAALLGPARPGGGEDVPQPRHEAEGAGVHGLDDADLLLPGLAQPAGPEVVLAQPLVQLPPEGDRAVLIALGQGRNANPGLIALEPTEAAAEAVLGACDQVLEGGAALGQHPDEQDPEMDRCGEFAVGLVAAVLVGDFA